MLPNYNQLTTVNRGAPCLEYPGMYYIYHNGEEVQAFSAECGETEAFRFLARVVGAYDDMREYTLAWSADHNDPRIGQVWFTGFYTVNR